MTKLECRVITCANNADNACCRPDIEVAGACACASEQTCCSSYLEKTEGAFSNAVGYSSPNDSLEIGCEAHNCVYNADGACAADSIRVDGESARAKSQTACATFQNR